MALLKRGWGMKKWSQLIIALCIMCESRSNELIQVTYWHNSTTDILCAAINFDFDGSQAIQELSNEEKDGFHTYEFLFPGATISSRQAQTQVDALHAAFNTSGMKVAVDTVMTPVSGVRIRMRLDEKNVELLYGSYDALLQRGIAHGFDAGYTFALYNKAMVKKLEGKKHEPTIYSACYQGSSCTNTACCLQA